MPEWLKKIIEVLKGGGVITDENESKITDLLKDIKITNPSTGEPPKNNDQAIAFLKQELETLRGQNSQLLEALNKETKSREDSIKAQQDKAKADFGVKVKAAVDKAIVTDKKYPESMRETLTKNFTNAFESTQALVDAAKPMKEAGDDDPGKGGGDNDKNKFTVQAKGPLRGVDQGLLKVVNEMNAATEQ